MASSLDDISMHIASAVEAARMVGESSMPEPLNSLSSAGKGLISRRRRWWTRPVPSSGKLRTMIARHTKAPCSTRASEMVDCSERMFLRRATWGASVMWLCKPRRLSKCSTATVMYTSSSGSCALTIRDVPEKPAPPGSMSSFHQRRANLLAASSASTPAARSERPSSTTGSARSACV